MQHYAYPPPQPLARPAARTHPAVPLGAVCLVLAVLEVVWFGYKLVAALVAGLLDYLQGRFLPGAVPAPVSSAVAKVTEKARLLTGLEVASLVPPAGLALVLGGIGIGLLLKRPSALTWARAWCVVAFVTLLGTLAVQVFAIAPQLAEIERFLDTHLAGPHGRSSVVLPTMAWMIGHSILLALWPIVLWVWSGHVRARR